MANYVSQVTLPDGTSYDVRELFPHVGNCTDAAATAAKTVTIGNFKLYTGAWVVVKFSNTNSADVATLTLNVDGTGAKPIKYKNANLGWASQLTANRYTHFIYDGTNYQIIGDVNTDTYDRTSQQTRIYAGTVGVFNYSLCALDNNQRMQSFTTTAGTGTSKAFNTSAKFMYPAVIMYNAANSTYANGTAIANNVLYEQFPSVDLRYSCNKTTSAGFTQYKPVYLECTLNSDGTLSITANGLTQTFVTGKYYLLLGCMYNTSVYQLALFAQHPLFYYDGTNLNCLVFSAAEKTKLAGIEEGANKYVHPTYTSKTSGLYKITVDGTGHVSGTDTVTASDLPAHTHPYLPDTTLYAGSSTQGGPATYVALPRVTEDAKSFPGTNKVAFKEYSNTSTNTPSSAWYHIISMQGSDNKYGTQLALGMTTTGVYYRNYNSQTWSSWQPMGRFTATPTSGQVVITDGTTGGIKSSGYTIAKSVPSDAVFTDTHVKVTSNDTTKAWLIGSTTSPNGTAVEGVADTNVYLGTTSGELCAGMVTISNSQWAPLSIKRVGTQSAGIKFINNNGDLGYIAMNSVNGPLMRWKTDSTTSYNILDTSSTSFTQVLTSGTKIGTIKIDGTSTDIFIPSDTDIHVRQNVSTSTDWYPVLLGAYHTASPTTAFSPTQTTDESYLTDKMWLQPSTGRLTTKGDIILYSPDSNPTPGIYFRRGSYTDSTLDWRIYNNAGLLTFERTVEGEAQSWQTKVQFKGDGIYYENTKLEGDTKVSQSASTTANYRPIVLGYTNTTTPSSLAGTVTNQVYVTTNMYAQPSTGTIYSTYFRGTIYKDGGTWIQDRDTAPVYANKENSGQIKYYPIGFAKSKDGGWSIGSLGSDNNFYVIYTTDANYSTSTNQKVEIKFPTTDGTLALTSDIPVITASASNGYLSVNNSDVLVYSTGLIHSKFNYSAANAGTDSWESVGVTPSDRVGYVLRSIRYNQYYPPWGYSFGAGIVFGGADTKGMINFKYDTPHITFVGGNHSESKTAPVWYMKISGTSGATYNLANFVTTDTKNTAGSTDTSSKIFLIGATSQAANPQTYSQDTAYVGTDGHVYSNSKQVVNLSDTQALTNKTYNGYTLAAACAKAVVTSIDTSASLPTSNAVKTFVEGKGYVTTDTKNTAGATDTSSKIFLIGATSQAANPQTYSDNEVYTTSGVLTTKSVQVGGGSCTMQYNSTTQSLDFVFV